MKRTKPLKQPDKSQSLKRTCCINTSRPSLVIDRITLDSAEQSKREYDEVNGYLFVHDNPFTREQVAEYKGKEIPDYQKFGFDPEGVYRVYRPAEELQNEATLKSLRNLPFTLEHVPVDPNDPPKNHIIGSAGSNPKWEAPYLKNMLCFTDAHAINLVKSGKMKELSLGYFYTPVVEKGTAPDGTSYDVKMTNIVANHIALVEEGRAGHDVVVQDSKPRTIKKDKLTMDQTNAAPANL